MPIFLLGVHAPDPHIAQDAQGMLFGPKIHSGALVCCCDDATIRSSIGVDLAPPVVGTLSGMKCGHCGRDRLVRCNVASMRVVFGRKRCPVGAKLFSIGITLEGEGNSAQPVRRFGHQTGEL